MSALFDATRDFAAASDEAVIRQQLVKRLASASSIRRYGGGFDDATRVDLASTIEEEAARLDAFVGNLLSMTRLEAGALVIQRIGFSVPEVVERVIGRRHIGARNVNVLAAQDVVEGAGDPGLFEQVFGNVFENAIRYSPADRPISISTTLEDEKIVVRILDEGPGVPVEDIPHIFEKFYRSPSVAQKPGTGLGLAIARGLVEGMGGSICVRNRDPGNIGLMVQIQLPVMR
jgi:two-component system sensor histidine kinase KdpD